MSVEKRGTPEPRHVAPKFGNFCKFTAGETLRLAGIVGFGEENKIPADPLAQAERALASLHEGLAALEGSQLVTPPPGLEVGYVPVPLYEGIERHQDCVDPPTTCAQLSALKNIRDEDKWCSDLTSQGAVRCAEHFIRRSDGRYSPCIFEGGTCMGAQLMLTCPSPPPPPPPP
jgi:hypothetical protein